MTGSAVPPLLVLGDDGPRRYRVTQPETSAEGRDVVFSGQLIGQIIMASSAGAPGKDVRSVHTVFARAGTYTKPIALEVEPLHAGKTWASDTVTAVQDGAQLCRALVLLHRHEPDLVRHGPAMPDVPGPDEVDDAPGQVFPGAAWRPIPPGPGAGQPVEVAWHRFPLALGPQAAHQAVLVWATCGHIIGLAMRPHGSLARIEDAHRSLSTGVIAHTVHFFEPLDATRWHLVVTDASAASNGRVYGAGSIFTPEGVLVAAFHQDSMAKSADHTLDPRRSL